MVDACLAYGLKPFYGPVRRFLRRRACEAQFRNAFLHGCVGTWTLHPSQIDIAKRVFSLEPTEVAFAKRIVEAMPDGTGAAMIDGKMQDDATWKQAKVILDLAKLVAARTLSARLCMVSREPKASSACHWRIDGCKPQPDIDEGDRAVAEGSGRMANIGQAKFQWGQVVRHRIYPFRGVIFDIDPVFNNTEEWWQSIPAEVARRRSSRSITCWRRTRRPNTSPMFRSRTCCPTFRRAAAPPSDRGDVHSSATDGNYRALFLEHPH